MSTTFNCCVQCQNFWTCKRRIENYTKEETSFCCDSCNRFDICKIVAEKLKVDAQGVTQ